jgi:RND family efflux transporter MFP subunit
MLPILLLGGVPAFWWFKAYGKIEARAIVRGSVYQVGTHVEGVLDKVLVDMGDVVKTGQVVAKLDTTELEARIREQEGELAQAKAQRDRLHSEWKRIDRLTKRGYESANVGESAYYAYKAAEAQVESTQAALEAVKARAKLAEIRSTVDGVVLWDPLRKGAVVDRDDPVMSLLEDGAMWIVAYVSEEDRSRIRPGQLADVEVEGIPDQIIRGRVVFLYRGVKFRPRGLRTYDTPAETYQPVKIVPEDPSVLRGHASYGMRAVVTIFLD